MARFTLKPVGSDDFDRPGRYYYRISVDSAVPADVVWAELHSARPLSWCVLIRSCQWLPGSPHGIGSQRVVGLAPGVRVFERYFIWQESTGHYQNAFTVDQSSVPGLRRFGERYTVTPQGAGSRFVWEFHIEPAAPPALGRLVRWPTQKVISRFARETQGHFDRLAGNLGE